MMMTSKTRLFLSLFMALIMGASTIEDAFAHGGGGWNRGGRVGIYLGAPIGFNFGYSPYSYYGGPYYGSPYYYSPAPIFYPPVQSAPVIYTERRNEVRVSKQEAPRNLSKNVQKSWWYYCVDAKTYYPYVNKCPGGWLRVAPEPAPDSDDQPAVNNVPAP